MHDPTPPSGRPPGSSARTSAEPGPADTTGGLLAQGRSLLRSLQTIVGELPGLLSDRFELLTLELKRAGRALARVVLLLVAATVLAVTAWIALWEVAVIALTALGLSNAAALLIVIASNGALAAWALREALSQGRLVSLPATRRRLSFHKLEPAAQAPVHVPTPSSSPAPPPPPPPREDELADPVGDGHSDADLARTLPPRPPAAQQGTGRLA